MPSRVERNYNKTRTNKRTIRNQGLYENSEYRIISDTKEILSESLGAEPVKNESNILKTEKLTSFIMEGEKERDINKILKNALSSRNIDELEKKRKLDKKEYNITKKININDEKAVSEFRNQSRKVVEDEEELTNLIDTIYSKTSTNNDLFGDLMPTSTDEVLISDTLDITLEKSENKENLSNSFFTSSLELSDEDLVDDVIEVEVDEEEDFLEEDKPVLTKIFVTIILVVVFIAIIAYAIYKCFL